MSKREAKTSLVGVNTGFGGSADTRTEEAEELQATLIGELHSGILVKPKAGKSSKNEDVLHSPYNGPLYCEDPESNTCMPEAWTRASLLIRI